MCARMTLMAEVILYGGWVLMMTGTFRSLTRSLRKVYPCRSVLLKRSFKYALAPTFLSHPCTRFLDANDPYQVLSRTE